MAVDKKQGLGGRDRAKGPTRGSHDLPGRHAERAAQGLAMGCGDQDLGWRHPRTRTVDLGRAGASRCGCHQRAGRRSVEGELVPKARPRLWRLLIFRILF